MRLASNYKTEHWQWSTWGYVKAAVKIDSSIGQVVESYHGNGLLPLHINHSSHSKCVVHLSSLRHLAVIDINYSGPSLSDFQQSCA